MRLVSIVEPFLDSTQILVCKLLLLLREQNYLIILFGCYFFFNILATMCCGTEKERIYIPDEEHFILL
jgi:hypothetical protein